MPLQAADIPGLVAITLKELGRNKWQEVSQSLQRFTAAKKLWTKKRITEDSGTEIQFNFRDAIGDRAVWRTLDDADAVNLGGTLYQAAVPWRHITTNLALHDVMILMNRNPAKIVDLVKTQRTAAELDLMSKIESAFWTKPATSADVRLPWGLEYWVTPHASAGFNGGAATGFTTKGGVDPSTHSNFTNNYTFRYAAVSQADLVRALRLALYKTGFVSPVTTPGYEEGGPDVGMYSTYDVVRALEELAEAQNDNNGSDLAKYDGMATIRRIAVEPVPFLDTGLTAASAVYGKAPIYGIDWSVYHTVFLQGRYRAESGIIRPPDHHDVTVVYEDTTCNFVCHEPRRQFLGSTA